MKKAGILMIQALKYAVPVAVSVGLCWYLFRNMDLREMFGEIRHHCDFKYIVISMLIGVSTFFLRAARWNIQLYALGIRPPYYATVYSIAGLFAVNLVFPRLGELWRSEYISRRQKAPFSVVFGSMLADRAADVLFALIIGVFTFILAAPAFRGFVANYPEFYNKLAAVFSSPWTYIVLAAIIAIFWWLMKKGTGKWAVKIQKFIRQLLEGFMSVFHMKGVGLWFLLTFLLWGAYFSEMLLGFYAFDYTRGILEEHGMLIVLVAFTMSTFAMGVPSNGGFGPYQLAVMFAISCFVASPNTLKSGAFANLVLGAQTFVAVVCGLIAFILIAIDNRRLSRRERS